MDRRMTIAVLYFVVLASLSADLFSCKANPPCRYDDPSCRSEALTQWLGILLAPVNCTDDTLTWTSVPASEASGWWTVTYGDRGFVALAINGTNFVMHLVQAHSEKKGPLRPIELYRSSRSMFQHRPLNHIREQHFGG